MKVRYKAALCCIEGGGLISGCSCDNPIHEYVYRETNHPLPGDEIVEPATPAPSDQDASQAQGEVDAQLNLYRQAERDREARRRAEEAFDLIAPFVAKFAGAAKHYDGGRPRYEGSVLMHDADPSYKSALTGSATGIGGPGAPASPTLGDLRMLADAYAMASDMLAAALSPAPGATAQDGVERDLARQGKIDPCEYCFGVTRHDADCRAVKPATPTPTAPSFFRKKAWTEAARETDRLCYELDITNADHIVLWLEQQLNGHVGPLAYIACRILDAHEAALAATSTPTIPAGMVADAFITSTSGGGEYVVTLKYPTLAKMQAAHAALVGAAAPKQAEQQGVERAARAMCVADGLDPDEHIIGGQATGFEDFGPLWQAEERSEGQLGLTNYKRLALAALNAPTGAGEKGEAK